ncbi:MAG: hypothetical protein DDT32_00850 [Syntrophomonadaceae bacterium]|nr:hypothetical protein [Bacillota bacterium]
MFKLIKECNRCGLYNHQKPLMDEVEGCRVFWVGLSAKISACEGERPLSPATNSGDLLCRVEGKCLGVPMYRTNLVKCAPLDGSGKLRYPNRNEIELCLPHLGMEIEELAPQIVFLLGGKVIDAVGRHFSIKFENWNGFNYPFRKHGGMYYVPVHHPSYIYVYKRKMSILTG